MQVYVDRPGRDLSIAEAGWVAWADVEPGCLVTAQEVRDVGTAITAAGLRYGTYGNRTSISAVFGDSPELAAWPLWYANYIPPCYDWFQPFNGFQQPALWQYTSGGYLGINCDLSITPDGRIFADLSNYSIENLDGTTFGRMQADFLKYTLDGVVLGLQDADIARYFKALLS